VKIPYSRRTAGLFTAAAASAGALVTAVALVLPASAGQASASAPAHHSPTLTVRQIAFGAKLHHSFRPGGTGAWTTETLTGPDDLSFLDGHIYVGFQNGVGSQGEPSTSGNLDSTVVEFTVSGREVRQWDVKGKVDGLTADPSLRKVIATVNEDGNSSLYTISPHVSNVTPYTYNKPLPHNGGTDAISIFHGQILISASAPGTTGSPAPQPTYPAVYGVTLDFKTKVATVHALFSDEATAKTVNGPDAGKDVKLGLTDPDSSEVVPFDSPRFRGDFMLNSQGDQELIFDHVTGRWHQGLSVLSLPTSVDDTAWATRGFGALYTTDSGADTLDVIYGDLDAGTAYTAVTPCNANSAPSTCPAPGFPANYLGTVNLWTGALTKVHTSGAAVQPKGMIFVPFGF
jgi:hypothetical protein